MDRRACWACGRQVVWVPTAATGKRMPLDIDEESGNVLVDASGRAHVFRDRPAAIAAADADQDLFGLSPDTFITHRAQCPIGEQSQGRHGDDADAPAAPAQEPIF